MPENDTIISDGSNNVSLPARRETDSQDRIRKLLTTLQDSEQTRELSEWITEYLRHPAKQPDANPSDTDKDDLSKLLSVIVNKAEGVKSPGLGLVSMISALTDGGRGNDPRSGDDFGNSDGFKRLMGGANG